MHHTLRAAPLGGEDTGVFASRSISLVLGTTPQCSQHLGWMQLLPSVRYPLLGHLAWPVQPSLTWLQMSGSVLMPCAWGFSKKNLPALVGELVI